MIARKWKYEEIALQNIVSKWVKRWLRVWKVGGWNPGRVKSKTEKLAPVASLVSVHHLRPTSGLVGPVSV